MSIYCYTWSVSGDNMLNEIMQNEIVAFENSDNKTFWSVYQSQSTFDEKKDMVLNSLGIAAHFIACHQYGDAKQIYKEIRGVIFNLSISVDNLSEIVDILTFILENPVEHDVFRIFIACAMSIASKEFRDNLHARLKIYEVLLNYDPFDNRLKSLMRKLARDDFSLEKSKIYELLDKYSEKNRKLFFAGDNLLKSMKRADVYLCNDDQYSARKIYRNIKDYIVFDVVPEQGLDDALAIFEEVMKFKNPNDCFGLFIASLMSLASREYRHDLSSRLRIYSMILEHYPGDKQTIGIMKALARDEYADDFESFSQINKIITKYVFEDEYSVGEPEKFKELWLQLKESKSVEIAGEMKKILSHSMGNKEFLEAAYGTYLEFAQYYPEFIPQ